MPNPPLIDAAAWVLDIFHPTAGTIKCATMDLSTAAAAATLGGGYPGLIKNGTEITVVHELPDGIDLPSGFTVRLSNVGHPVTDAVPFDASLEWRDVPVRLRYYDLTNDVALEEFTGVISTVDFPPGAAVFGLSSHGEAELTTMIPTSNAIVDSARFPKASDPGAPLPVYFGEGLGSPPYIGRDDEGSTSSAGGMDFGVSAQPGTQIIAAFWDSDQNTPGLEAATQWESVLGTCTRTSATTFTVTGNDKHHYFADASFTTLTGLIVRWLNSGDPTFHYSVVVAFNATTQTATIADAEMAGTISDVRVAFDFLAAVKK